MMAFPNLIGGRGGKVTGRFSLPPFFLLAPLQDIKQVDNASIGESNAPQSIFLHVAFIHMTMLGKAG